MSVIWKFYRWFHYKGWSGRNLFDVLNWEIELKSVAVALRGLDDEIGVQDQTTFSLPDIRESKVAGSTKSRPLVEDHGFGFPHVPT